ncbi:type II toxin-antitoxin system HicB family antitoxin [Endozoicomonas ascidiicola]|uniref:type II toxin-antitoxin system HicB family antitoxin n=1 Tax=Endozoicomonas ascidiicola TaxID=1698521 RepID=UPI00082C7E9C|nr:type II toxin-antitoxin system HicB family antitoxin [Endozoicomonas ascidiicola]
MRYPIVLHTDDNVHYGATVPDIPGCFSAGEGIDETLAHVEDAIAGHLEILCESQSTIPEAGKISEHQSNPDYANGIWAFVDIDITPYLGKAERVNITLPQYLLYRIDEMVKTHPAYRSRSAFLQDAALDKMRDL